MRRLVDQSGTENLSALPAFDLWEPCVGIAKDATVVLRRFVLMLTQYLSVSQWVNNTTVKRDAHTVVYTRENLWLERIWSRIVVMFSAVKTALLGQFCVAWTVYTHGCST